MKTRATALGRFVLRLSSCLHAALRGATAAAGLSLNDSCARTLAAPIGNLSAFDGARLVVTAVSPVVPNGD
ncbi:MAG: toxin-antitoxin system HicB family antitoxin [Acidobacteria bacterium]|nr:toxin-antitoxin system HicB family antitoxin [Acidobacteriota bacterium]